MLEKNDLQSKNYSPSELIQNSSMVVSLDPLGDGISSVELIRVSGSDIDVVNAARVSYGKTVNEMSDNDKKLISFLMKHKHTSPFEHNQLSFRIKCPIFVARQWMRHRMNSYNEISYRYVKAAHEFYIPKQWRHQDTHNKQSSKDPFEDQELLEQYKNALNVAVKTYEHLIENQVCRELARGLLPVCTYTEFIFTCNLHSLLNFLTLRLHPGAQWEIQQYGYNMLDLAQPYFPISIAAWKEIHMIETK